MLLRPTVWMVEDVSYKSLYQVKMMLANKRMEAPRIINRDMRALKSKWVYLGIELDKDKKTLRWYSTKTGFYLGTEAYYSVKNRYKEFRALQDKIMARYKELENDLRRLPLVSYRDS